MNRTNLVLLVVFLIVFSIWFATKPSADESQGVVAARMFPDLNKEAVDAIEVSGGWKGSTYQYVRSVDGWVLASGGGFPVTTEAARDFIEAVASIRKDNLVGTSAELAEITRTGDQGRTVRLYRGDEVVAEFVVGKRPEGDWQAFFLRGKEVEGEDLPDIFRTKTLTDEEAAKPSSGDPMMGARGSQAFDWAQYVDEVFKWTKTQIWNLDDGEIQALKLVRPGDAFNVDLAREEEDKWALTEPGKEPARADSSAVESITSQLAYLAFEEVVGASNDPEAREMYGLDDPVITLIITLKKKIEKPAPKEGEEEKKEGEEEEKKETEPEYKIIKRIISVGSKVKMPRSIDDESGEIKEEELYAVTVSGDLDDPTKGSFIFLVNDYKIGPLKKPLEDLRLKEEEPKDDEPEDGEPQDGEPQDGEPTDDEPKDSEPKNDDPKDDEPKEATPKDETPKEDEPSDEPKKEEPTEPGR